MGAMLSPMCVILIPVCVILSEAKDLITAWGRFVEEILRFAQNDG